MICAYCLQGDTIVNNCFIENISPEEFTQIGQLIWKKSGSNDLIIGIGNTLMAPGNKYKLETYDGPGKSQDLNQEGFPKHVSYN